MFHFSHLSYKNCFLFFFKYPQLGETAPLVSKNLVTALWGPCWQTNVSHDPKIQSIFSGPLNSYLVRTRRPYLPPGYEKLNTPSVQVKRNKIIFMLKTPLVPLV